MKRTRLPKRISQSSHGVLTSEGPVNCLLKRSSARRTLCISVDEKASVQIAAPYTMPLREIESFIHSKAQWILKGIKQAQERKEFLDQKSFSNGQEFLFLGEKCPLEIKRDDVKRTRIIFKGHKWTVTVSNDLTGEKREKEVKRKLIQWYRAQAEEILGGRIFHYSRIMKREPKKIAIRTQKRMWGCCDYRTQTIHLNWQIILSPIKVVDYIVVHEMCHLFIPNHSKCFWSKVAKVMPDFDKYRKWLKVNSLDMILP